MLSEINPAWQVLRFMTLLFISETDVLGPSAMLLLFSPTLIVVLIYFKEHKRMVTIPVIPPQYWNGADSWNAYGRQGPFNSLRSIQNGRHFADDVFKSNFLNENVLISIKISLKFVPKGPINNIPALVEIMAWRRPGDKPLSEPRMESLLTHVCVTRLQWVNLHKHGDVRHQGISIYMT